MNYLDSIRYLYSLQKFGIKLGLRKIRSLLESCGNPEEKFRSIHIAGTNGKGSTAAMIASILHEAGYKVGLYTSPHLVDFTERIRINGRGIEKEKIAEYTGRLRQQIDKLKCTFFESTTALAFLHFAEEEVDLAVIETGLGGRLDATNVLQPLLTVITNIGLDHTEHLGKTIGSIAREKAGILKSKVSCLIGRMESSAERVVRKAATKRGTKVISAPAVATYRIRESGLDEIRFDLRSGKKTYRDLSIPLGGHYQAENARLAVLACEMLKERRQSPGSRRGGVAISSPHIYDGLRSVDRNTGLRGRLETIQRKPRVIVDVAHNPDAIHCLVEALRTHRLRKLIVVFGVMKDKNYREMLLSLREIADELITVSARISRALDYRILFKAAHHLGLKASRGGSVQEGIGRAMRMVKVPDTVLITGSHYVVGEAIEVFES